MGRAPGNGVGGGQQGMGLGGGAPGNGVGGGGHQGMGLGGITGNGVGVGHLGMGAKSNGFGIHPRLYQ